MIIVLSVLALVMSLTGNIFINFKKRFGYIVWIVSNVLWIIINFTDHLNVSQVIMYLVYTVLNAQGYILWSKNNTKE